MDFFTLANHFEPQSNALFCGPTTAAIVLNSLRERKTNLLPKDGSGMSNVDRVFLPKGFNPTVPKYTQRTVVEVGPKPRKKVFGQPTSVKGKMIKDFGYQLRQFDELLRAHNVETNMVVVDDSISNETVIRSMVANLEHPNDYVIVNYKRSVLGQKGGGHLSPVGAYEEKSNSFLVMDVNPTKAKWVWISAPVLVSAMRTFDTIENRGFILVKETPH